MTSPEKEFIPRRSLRKRRSTAGASIINSKKPKPEHSPGKRTREDAEKDVPPEIPDQDDFWGRMGGLLGGMESRLRRSRRSLGRP